MGGLTDLTDETFDAALARTPGPAVVEFHAPWCGPCATLRPILGELADHFAGKVVFARVDTDDCPDLCCRFDVATIPTLLIFHAGAPVERLVGIRPRADIAARLYRFTER